MDELSKPAVVSGDIDMSDDWPDEDVVDCAHQKHPIIGEDYAIPKSVKELDLTHNNISVMQNLDGLTDLRKLHLRQNQISVIAGLEDLKALTYLDLYENELKTIQPSLQVVASSLTYLDLSFNRIRVIEHLKAFTQLKELYLVQNKITEVGQDVESLTNLKTLELGANRIRTIEHVHSLPKLENLWLGKNKITEIRPGDFENLHALQRISLQSNRLTKLLSESFAPLTSLLELYLSHNGIERIEGLEALTQLRVLDVGNNRITQFTGVGHLKLLVELWFNHNRVSSWAEVQDTLASLPELRTVYLEGNPVASDPRYRAKLMDLAPHLTQIDATYVYMGRA